MPQRNIKRQLRRWLDSLDRTEVEAQLLAGEPRQEMLYEHDGWTLRFRAIPRRWTTDGTSGRTIGVRGLGVRTVSIVDSVRHAAKSKASRYGEIDLPLVVAINVQEEFADVTQERDALFG
ncbi:hypothetical protein [Paraburkholderia youngii]|uniref:Uncharacterized protein n=1 Tax=Paraburkholderia youngii TaxID=2782701 RepID=A0A7Y6JZ74_9BURK|nr:hypothetical protein [Paraburkholderia youngii]NUY01435.1 hypothetical protein [Paraburkholderia youngii]